MKILIEEHPYPVSLVKDILEDLISNRDLDKDGKVNVKCVGYYYNPTLNDCVFILPKVLLEDVDGQEKVFGKYMPEDIIDLEENEKLEEGRKLRDNEKRFIYELSVWVYQAIFVFNQKIVNNNIVLQKTVSKMGHGRLRMCNTFLDILLAIQKFNRENQDFFFTILKNLHSGFNKINWTRTISLSQAFIQNDCPIYLNPVNKKRTINFDEELLVIFFSILYHIHDKYGIPVILNVNIPLITGKKFENYLNGMGMVRLRQIKYKYFSDKALYLWDLCFAFFEKSKKIRVEIDDKEYLLAKNFYVVFEAIIDELIGDSKDNLPADFKEQKDGKLIDHLYTYSGLIDADSEQLTYYIGDSKYYKLGAPLGDTSIYKQYTYARNIVQYNIDLWLDEKVPNPDIRLRDDVTEGYNIIPNFFISAAMAKNDLSYNHREIELTNVSDKRNPEIKYQFKDRLFDRDTMLLSRYNVNFLFVISLYARNKQSEKAAWKEEVREQFRNNIRQVLEREYSFFPMRSKGVVLDEYITKHFRLLNGKVYTPFQDKSILTLALHTPNGRNQFTTLQAKLLSMLREDFYIDENYSLGAEPQLPLPTNIQFNIEDFVLVGYYRDEEQLNWILNKKHYNVRSGKDHGSLDLSASVCAARFLLLYGKNGDYKFRLKPNTLRIWDKQDMINDDYKNPHHDFYLVFFIEEQLTDGDFAKMEFDKDKLNTLLNKHGKNKANHDKGAIAVSFTELVNCKVMNS